MDTLRDKYQAQFSKIKGVYNELLDGHVAFLHNYIDQKLQYFFEDLESQVSRLNHPKNAQQVILYKETIDKIEALKENLTEFDAELRSFSFSR